MRAEDRRRCAGFVRATGPFGIQQSRFLVSKPPGLISGRDQHAAGSTVERLRMGQYHLDPHRTLSSIRIIHRRCNQVERLPYVFLAVWCANIRCLYVVPMDLAFRWHKEQHTKPKQQRHSFMSDGDIDARDWFYVYRWAVPIGDRRIFLAVPDALVQFRCTVGITKLKSLRGLNQLGNFRADLCPRVGAVKEVSFIAE